MKISTQSNSLTLDKAEKTLSLLKKAGFDGADFSMGGILSQKAIAEKNISDDNLLLQDESTVRAYFTQLKSIVQNHNMEIFQTHAPFSSGFYGHDAFNEKMAKVLKNAIVGTGCLGCKYTVVHPIFIPAEENPTPKATEDYVIQFYSQFIPVAKENGVMVLLENLFNPHRGKPQEVVYAEMEAKARYIDKLNELAGGEWFGLCLDTGHLNLCGVDIPRIIKTFGHRIKALHVHDNNGQADQHLFPFTVLKGIPWPQLIEALKEIRYQGVFNFETCTMNLFPETMRPEAFAILAKIGRYFAEELEATA